MKGAYREQMASRHCPGRSNEAPWRTDKCGYRFMDPTTHGHSRENPWASIETWLSAQTRFRGTSRFTLLHGIYVHYAQPYMYHAWSYLVINKKSLPNIRFRGPSEQGLLGIFSVLPIGLWQSARWLRSPSKCKAVDDIGDCIILTRDVSISSAYV